MYNIRDGKATGGDGISGEVWKYEEIRGNTGEKYGGEELEERVWEFCNKV